VQASTHNITQIGPYLQQGAAAGRDYDTLEKTLVQRWLQFARDYAVVAAKRECLTAR
jgi:hypothetical protein